MPDFANPFSGMVPDRKLTTGELLRALRLDLAAEEEAVHLYMSHADATDNPLAKKVLIDIANEERVHVGEFHRVIQLLSGDEDQFIEQGAQEVNDMAAEIGESKPHDDAAPGAPAERPTIGLLKS